jgi:glycosyltransferase involved in cell wall biosynthesis
MRVLHIEKMPFANSGVTSYVRALTSLQRRRGYEVFLFGCSVEGAPRRSTTRRGPRPNPLLPQFHDLAARRQPAAVCRMIHNTEAANKLQAFLRHQPVDVAHIHNIYHHLTPSILPVLGRRRIGMVMSVHDYRLACPTKHFLDRTGPCTRCLPNKFHHALSPRCAGLPGVALALESFYHRFWRSYFRWVDFFACPTEFMRSVLLALGAPGSKCVVLPNVVEPLVLPAGTSQSDRHLLFVGRLTPEKAPQLMLELASRLPDAQVTIVGDGPLLGKLCLDVSHRRLGNVTFTGAVDHQELGKHLASATAVVITSRCFENSPQVLLEAMTAGRCAIVPDHGPMRQWVRDRQTGRVYAPGDADSLAAAASEVLANATERRRMAQAAAELMAARHDPQAIVDRLEELYREAGRRCALR